MKRVFLSFSIAVLGVLSILGPAAAGPPSDYSQHQASVSLRDAAGDVLMSDGLGIYAGRDTISRIIDRDHVADTNAASDTFQLQPWGKRRLRIQSSVINAGTPITCESLGIVWFKSATTPDWYNAASPSVGDANFICWEASYRQGWTVNYPDGVAECVQFTRVDATTWTFSAPSFVIDPLAGPSGCPATVSRVVKQKGSATPVEQWTGVSAPFEATAVVQP